MSSRSGAKLSTCITPSRPAATTTVTGLSLELFLVLSTRHTYPTTGHIAPKTPSLRYCSRLKGVGWSMTLLGASATRCLLNAQLYSCPSATRRLFSSCPPNLIKIPNKKPAPDEPKDKWNYNANPFDGKVSEDHRKLRLVDANELEKETKPPHGVKMLARDFIEDSLYNPNYGYFPKQATIFNGQDTTFNFTKFRDSAEFQEEVAAKYAEYGSDRFDGPGRQLWHTPTELFKVCPCQR